MDTFPELFTIHNQNGQVTLMTHSFDLCSVFGGRAVLSYKYKSVIGHNMSIRKDLFPRNYKTCFIIMNVTESSSWYIYIYMYVCIYTDQEEEEDMIKEH